MTTTPLTTVPETTLPPLLPEASVRALATLLGVDGEIEYFERNAQCIGRLEPRGLCINGPIWGAWQYWDVDAQSGPAASEEQALAIAANLFAALHGDPGPVTAVKENGSQRDSNSFTVPPGRQW